LAQFRPRYPIVASRQKAESYVRSLFDHAETTSTRNGANNTIGQRLATAPTFLGWCHGTGRIHA
jgi:hypothetical protein